jgi:hypothetical protein
MNNNTLYKAQINPFRRGVHISLLGDPTLRLDAVAPAANLSATRSGPNVALNWSTSAESVAGYHVYRAATPGGPYTRLSPRLLTTSTFIDRNRTAAGTYMVRAIKLQVTPSGTYWNPSQGIFASVGRLGT